jgi:hypothetical protein
MFDGVIPLEKALRPLNLSRPFTCGCRQQNAGSRADVRFAFTQTLRGRKSGKCVSQNRRNATAPKCWRTVTAGTIGVAGHPGANQLRFRGRLSSGRTLEPGRYTLTATATNIAGQHSDPRSLTFTIAKR